MGPASMEIKESEYLSPSEKGPKVVSREESEQNEFSNSSLKNLTSKSINRIGRAETVDENPNNIESAHKIVSQDSPRK